MNVASRKKEFSFGWLSLTETVTLLLGSVYDASSKNPPRFKPGWDTDDTLNKTNNRKIAKIVLKRFGTIDPVANNNTSIINV